ncbi:glycosyltransferase family 4 protein [Epilithonimonas hominis]|uniref:Glycosyltransferase involved in cell wall bisynthesis n=1 Tax=Epilithonimonas hominis TaxID=420404 RepID=A0A1H6INT7_9FLAO|nr:glycosyltransferase family 4 protein [Epilithonimonas hominis]SEH47981.1 Glycosyltransferase involved in cell wall bisynthesis [Epilithonimonas hominis]
MKKLFRISTVPVSLNILLKGQLKYLDEYFDVTAISGKGADLEEVAQRENVKTYALAMQRQISPVKDVISLIKLYLYFKKEKPDIIHSITPKAGLLSMIAGKLAGVPIRIHTFTGLVFPYKKGMMQKILILMDKLLCICATNIYPEGRGVKNDLIEYGITQKPLKILGNGNINGIDLDYFNPDLYSEKDSLSIREKLNIGENDFVFLFVGRLVGDKGINELVKAFSELPRSSNQNIRRNILLLVGPYEHDLDPLLPDTIIEIENNPNIISVGFQKDVRPYFAISDVFVFPSYREGFPNVLLQAGAMGKFSIVTDINGSNEIIENHINGIIIPVRNEIALKLEMMNAIELLKKNQNLKNICRMRIKNMFEQSIIWEVLKNEYKNHVGNN